jgi:hypothetical protein
MLKSLRILQMSVLLFNAFHQRVVLPAILFATIYSLTMSVFFLTVIGDTAPVLLRLFNVVLCVTAIITEIVVFGIAGKVHENSIQLVASMKRKRSYEGNKILKREVKALSYLKIQFGLRSYMEKSTCLTIMDFTMGQTANLLLARNVK